MLDIVSGRSETVLPYHSTQGNSIGPSIDAILFDGLKADQVVFIENAQHRFLRKLPEEGPHLFLTERGDIARHSTTKLFELLEQRNYYNPGRTLPVLDEAQS